MVTQMATLLPTLKTILQAIAVVGVILGGGFSPREAAQAADVGFNRRSSDPTNPFYQNINDFQRFVNGEYNTLNATQVGARQLDASKLNLKFDAEISVFFINEGANYRNQLGVNTTGSTVVNNQILFNDLTCTTGCQYLGYRAPSNQFGTPDNKPLQIGDYFNLGTVKAGTTLDFFLRQDGYNRPSAQSFYAQPERNSDKLQHLMAYDYNDILVLAWEDMTNGGDKDYNDVVFAVNIGKKNINQISTVGGRAVPEPATLVGGFIATAFGWLFKKHRQASLHA